MRRAARHLSAVAGRILFIGFTIQIILGLFWMCCNFTAFQEFGESVYYVAVSGSFQGFGRTGILYPVLLWLARGVGRLIPIPYYCIMYLLQLGAAFGSGFYFLRTVRAGQGQVFWNVWGSLALLTVPMAMQCHMAVLPASFTASFLLLELAFLWKAVREMEFPEAGRLAWTALFWLLTALLEPVYFYLGAAPVVFLFIYVLARFGKRNPGRILHQVLILCAFAGMILGINDLTRMENKDGMGQERFAAAVFSRCAWSTALRDWDKWPEPLRDSVEDSLIWSASYYADTLWLELIPYMEQELGAERTEEILLESAAEAWELYRGQILHETAWDIFGYSFSPIANRLFLGGRGYTDCCGRNYDIMRRNTPALAKYYVDYGCWWFGAGLALTALGELLGMGRGAVGRMTERMAGMPGRRQGGAGRILFSLWVCAATCGIVAAWHTMQGAGIMDYKHTIAIGSLWAAWMAVVCGKTVSGSALWEDGRY